MELETLEVKIQAQARQANGQIDALITRLGKLSSSLQSIDSSGINRLSTGVNRLSNSMSAMRSVDTRTFSALAKNLNKLSGINASGLNNASNAISTVSGSIRSLSGIDFKGNGLNAFVNSVTKLSSANLGSLSSFDFGSLGNKINQLSSSLSGAKKVQGNTIQLVNSIGRLASSSGSIAETASSLPSLGKAIRSVTNSLSSAKAVSENIIQFTSAIGQLAIAGKKTAQTASNLGILATELKKFMQVMSNAPVLNNNIIQMTQAIAQLASSGSKAGTASKGFASMFRGYSSGASTATKKSFSLASAIGKLYASYFLLFRGFGKIRDAIDIASSLTEVENVVRQTFGQYESLINNFAKTSIEKFGMSELSVKQFASRFQAMGVAMGFSQGKMTDMSINLTKLTADMASFYDVAQSDVAEDLQSIFTGQTRPLRAYGLDLTQATLKEWALTQGIEANFKTMTQAEKAMLRYQYVMANTATAQGDFARTADTWHNQITMLKENFKALGAVVGGGLINAFKPFIKVLNAVLQKVIAFAEMVTNALGSIFGWRYEASKGAGISGLADDIGSASDGMVDLSDAAGSAGKNTGGIAKNAKKAKKEIQQATRAFDELKVISKQSKDNTSGSGSGGSGGSGGGSGSGGSGGGNTGKLVQTDTIFKDYESKIKDLEGLGKEISGSLINAMKGIKWDEVYAEASGFGSGLAKFLNGLFEGQKGTTLFGETGKLIANSLNTVLHGLDSFGETFDWKQFGNSIADGINKFFQNFDFALLAQTLNAWAQGAFDAVKTAISNISWKDVWDGIKTFLSNLDVETVAIVIGALTIKKILKMHLAATAMSVVGTALSKAIASSLATKLGVEIAENATISSVLSTALSNKIGSLGTITGKIGKIALTVGSVAIAAEGGLTIGQAIGNAIADATQPEEMEEYRVTFTWSDLFSYSLDDWKQGFSDWWDDTFGPGFDEFWKDNMSGDFKFKIPFTSIELPSHNEMGKAINNWLKKEKKNIEKKLDNIVQITTEVKDTSSKWWSDVKKYWSKKVGKVKDFTTNVKNNAKDWWKNTKTWWSEKVGKVENFTTGVKNKASEWWSNVKKWWENTTAGKEVKKFTVNAKKAGGTWWKDVSNDWKEKVVNAGKTLKIGISFAKNALSNLWSSVTGFFGGKTVNVSTKATKKADGGVFSGGSWKPIKKYAVGGLPNMGQMFVAREAGPELVGTLGGHTAVMNNDQIVSSVSYGVAQAVKEVIQPLVKMGGGNNRPIQISLDGKVIFDSTRQSAKEYFDRTGRSPYPV